MAHRTTLRQPRVREPKLLLPVKMTEPERRRVRLACAEDGLSYAQLILQLLDERDARRKRQQAAQVHPLHQPKRRSAYPGGGA